MSVCITGSMNGVGSSVEPLTVNIFKNGVSHKLVGQISSDTTGVLIFNGSLGVVVGTITDYFTVVITNDCTTETFSTTSAYVALNAI
jgi:hypothetical protein